MGDMQGISLVELVREGAAIAVSVGHGREVKSLFLSPNVFITPLK
jgi:hypothetical protein